MDYTHVQVINVPSNIVKYVVTDQQKLFLDSSGHVHRKKTVKIPVKVISISSYNSVSIFATIDGIYTQGNDAFKQGLLGIHHKTCSKSALRMEIDGIFVECSISSSHAAAIRQDGCIFVWGNLTHIGINHKKPFELEIPDNSLPIQIHCGKSFTAVSVYPGELYIYKGSIVPFYINELKDVGLTWISGNENFVAMTSDKNLVYVWNCNGKLVNLPICEDYTISSIACSWKGILALCNSNMIYLWNQCRNGKFKGKMVEFQGKVKIFSGWKIALLVTIEDSLPPSLAHSRSSSQINCENEDFLLSFPAQLSHRSSLTSNNSSLQSTLNPNFQSISSEDFNPLNSLSYPKNKQDFSLIESYPSTTNTQSLSCAKFFSIFYRLAEKVTVFHIKKGFSKLKTLKKPYKKFVKILQDFLDYKFLGFSEDFFTILKERSEYLNYFIYSLNHFTILITRLRFKYKLETLISLKTHQISSAFLDMIKDIVRRRFSGYFSRIKLVYFAGCMENLVRNLSMAEIIQNFYQKKYALDSIAQVPVRMKKTFISYDKLILNMKQKKEKEKLAIRESLNSPKFGKKNMVFCVKNVSSPENQAGATERRLEYSLKLNQKLQKINLKRKSMDLDCKGVRKVKIEEAWVMVRTLIKPVSRVFRWVFLERKKRKGNSFSFLIKANTLSPRYATNYANGFNNK
ncbi:hypothetical protein SteCoe_2340 [Stentor coeruleus]|uniref:Uncharacterized protein n=1 Tax=Stentor coeruleus TaxID=5963 RepID=A0A1R2CZL8_9CILI|nr:hypothetical protein SteCoe_2340 [Stentor coeruleus]